MDCSLWRRRTLCSLRRPLGSIPVGRRRIYLQIAAEDGGLSNNKNYGVGVGVRVGVLEGVGVCVGVVGLRVGVRVGVAVGVLISARCSRASARMSEVMALAGRSSN